MIVIEGGYEWIHSLSLSLSLQADIDPFRRHEDGIDLASTADAREVGFEMQLAIRIPKTEVGSPRHHLRTAAGLEGKLKEAKEGKQRLTKTRFRITIPRSHAPSPV